MAPKKGSTQSKDAGLKRSIARRFNDSLMGKSKTSKAKGGDQRTARRLNRYRNELKEGKKSNNQELSPLDIAMRVHELMEHGDKIGDIRKLVKPREIEYDEETMTSLLKEMHPEYGFSPVAYRFAGVHDETLVAAGILDEMPKKRGPKKKADVEAEVEEETKAVPPVRRRRGRSK